MICQIFFIINLAISKIKYHIYRQKRRGASASRLIQALLKSYQFVISGRKYSEAALGDDEVLLYAEAAAALFKYIWFDREYHTGLQQSIG